MSETPFSASPLRLATSLRDANGATIVVTGEVDIATAPMLQHDLEALLDEGRAMLTIDLSGVTFMDSTGLGVVVRMHRRAEEAGGAVSLCGARGSTRRVLEISGVTRILQVTDEGPPGGVS